MSWRTAVMARPRAATAGPWRLTKARYEERPETNDICDMANDAYVITDAPHLSSWEADGEFIAHAREDLAIAMSRLDFVEKKLMQIRKEVCREDDIATMDRLIEEALEIIAPGEHQRNYHSGV